MKKNNTISALARTALLLSPLALTSCHTPLDAFPGPGPAPIYKTPVQDRTIVTRQGHAATRTMHKAPVAQGKTVSKSEQAASTSRTATTYTKKVTTTQTTTSSTPALIAPPTVQ